ncbi:MAG: diacylglycerol kinase family lipid kinase, partial [Firmicutes bacterium]|nr:diacylglycerol kinase family lipid kinase [Bacillota bacterium]
LIYNPNSGTRKSARYLSQVLEVFTYHGCTTTALPTLKRGDARDYVIEYGPAHDIVVAMGGDGTYNEVVAGLMASGLDLPLGYIPAGSTNDFAASMGLSKSIPQAAEDICLGTPVPVDCGTFNDRTFTYVACFGAFAKASYDTPQDIKNILGHLAYVLSGATTLGDIRPISAKVTVDGKTFEGKYLFGAVSNSTSMGGILKLKPEDVDLSDGLFEVMLVKDSSDLIEIGDLVRAAAMQDYDNTPMLTFIDGRHFEFDIPEAVDWSLDGEYQKGTQHITIDNRHNVINLIKRQK